jgi:hypothetical protein
MNGRSHRSGRGKKVAQAAAADTGDRETIGEQVSKANVPQHTNGAAGDVSNNESAGNGPGDGGANGDGGDGPHPPRGPKEAVESQAHAILLKGVLALPGLFAGVLPLTFRLASEELPPSGNVAPWLAALLWVYVGVPLMLPVFLLHGSGFYVLFGYGSIVALAAVFVHTVGWTLAVSACAILLGLGPVLWFLRGGVARMIRSWRIKQTEWLLTTRVFHRIVGAPPVQPGRAATSLVLATTAVLGLIMVSARGSFASAAFDDLEHDIRIVNDLQKLSDVADEVHAWQERIDPFGALIADSARSRAYLRQQDSLLSVLASARAEMLDARLADRVSAGLAATAEFRRFQRLSLGRAQRPPRADTAASKAAEDVVHATFMGALRAEIVLYDIRSLVQVDLAERLNAPRGAAAVALAFGLLVLATHIAGREWKRARPESTGEEEDSTPNPGMNDLRLSVAVILVLCFPLLTKLDGSSDLASVDVFTQPSWYLPAFLTTTSGDALGEVRHAAEKAVADDGRGDGGSSLDSEFPGGGRLDPAAIRSLLTERDFLTVDRAVSELLATHGLRPVTTLDPDAVVNRLNARFQRLDTVVTLVPRMWTHLNKILRGEEGS